MKPYLSITSAFIGAVAISGLLLAGCNDKITYVPVIESINLTPDTVTVGGTAVIELVVKDTDDEELVYYYSTNGGAISGVGDTVIWQAPDQSGVYVTRILIADKDGNQAVDSIKLIVLKNENSTQIAGVAAFPSGIDFDLANSKVRLFTSLTNWTNQVVFSEVSADGFGPIVSFRMDDVPIGTYYFDIWKDADFGNTLNAGDYYGWYGKGNILDPQPESFILEAGASKALQIQMWVVPSK